MELFWRTTLYLCLAWYSLVTVYVAIRGAADIRNMWRRLEEDRRRSQS